MIEFIRFYLQSGKFLERYPYLVSLLFIPYVVRFLVELILSLKAIIKKRSKLSKLIELQKNAEAKDQRLIDFMIQQIEDELFEECTGYYNSTKNKLIIDFYLTNRDKYSWKGIKLILSKFEIRDGHLRLKPISLLTRIEVTCCYVYYGLMALASLIVTLGLLTLRDKMSILAVPLFAVFAVSIWLLLVEGDKMRIYKRMLKEPGLKDEGSNKSDVEE